MAATAPPAPGDDRGFTLLELILVLVLIGISTSLVLPRVGEFLFTDPLKAAARGLTGLIGRASQLAQQRQAPYLLKYIERDRRFVVEPEIPADAERTERSGPERAGELRLQGQVGVRDIWSWDSGGRSVGDLSIRFTAAGYVEPTVIHLREGGDRDLSLVLSPFLGTIQIFDRYVSPDDATLFQ